MILWPTSESLSYMLYIDPFFCTQIYYLPILFLHMGNELDLSGYDSCINYIWLCISGP